MRRSTVRGDARRLLALSADTLTCAIGSPCSQLYSPHQNYLGWNSPLPGVCLQQNFLGNYKEGGRGEGLAVFQHKIREKCLVDVKTNSNKFFFFFLETLSRLHPLERGLEIRCHPGNRDVPFASKFGKVKSLWIHPTEDLLAFGRETSTDSVCLDLTPFWGFWGLLLGIAQDFLRYDSLLGCWMWLRLRAQEERARKPSLSSQPLGSPRSPSLPKSREEESNKTAKQEK